MPYFACLASFLVLKTQAVWSFKSSVMSNHTTRCHIPYIRPSHDLWLSHSHFSQTYVGTFFHCFPMHRLPSPADMLSLHLYCQPVSLLLYRRSINVTVHSMNAGDFILNKNSITEKFYFITKQIIPFYSVTSLLITLLHYQGENCSAISSRGHGECFTK
jgi:hypothetical protein